MSFQRKPARAGKPATCASQQKDQLWTAWMIAAQAGDGAAYDALVRSCSPFIRHVARSQGVRSQWIDDVVQETLLSIHRAHRTYDPTRSFTAWLRTIARRRSIDELRRAIRASATEVHAPLAYDRYPDGNDPELALVALHREALVESAVQSLPTMQRDAIGRIGDWKQMTGTSPYSVRSTGAIRVSWHRAIRALQARFDVRE